MTSTTIIRKYVSVDADGAIRLPKALRRSGAFRPGSKVLLWWSPPDETVVHLISEPDSKAQVVEWAVRVNAAIDDPDLTPEQRQAVVDTIPAALRSTVAVECYRTNENVSFSWVAAIAGTFTWEAPALLLAHGVEPNYTPMTAEEMDAEIAILEERGVLQPRRNP